MNIEEWFRYFNKKYFKNEVRILKIKKILLNI